jgi:hypothetical protein
VKNGNTSPIPPIWQLKSTSKNGHRSLNKIEKSLALLQFRSAGFKPRINHLFEPSSS